MKETTCYPGRTISLQEAPSPSKARSPAKPPHPPHRLARHLLPSPERWQSSHELVDDAAEGPEVRTLRGKQGSDIRSTSRQVISIPAGWEGHPRTWLLQDTPSYQCAAMAHTPAGTGWVPLYLYICQEKHPRYKLSSPEAHSLEVSDWGGHAQKLTSLCPHN